MSKHDPKDILAEALALQSRQKKIDASEASTHRSKHELLVDVYKFAKKMETNGYRTVFAKLCADRKITTKGTTLVFYTAAVKLTFGYWGTAKKGETTVKVWKMKTSFYKYANVVRWMDGQVMNSTCTVEKLAAELGNKGGIAKVAAIDSALFEGAERKTARDAANTKKIKDVKKLESLGDVVKPANAVIHNGLVLMVGVADGGNIAVKLALDIKEGQLAQLLATAKLSGEAAEEKDSGAVIKFDDEKRKRDAAAVQQGYAKKTAAA